ncbi:helix-turn-helix transcriptional regulator [Pseudoalteromonas sp. SR45-1]|uniref:helix-turn-helix domain-containing protein n=1 Tax=unclassified Pseudoalteromonas TaxID=194690 RepID=UPI00110CB716|nr:MULTISPECIES: helix-turn-helix transcriptional regulator [unclassified Pseudoalteromonas]MBB1327363.1 helix-turn-helix transcriptional regulator [Pseudoalteromonas sp. SR45-1]TMS82736.1 XRE family transcriptional regulator [Pseudoalteromonas sp. S554]
MEYINPIPTQLAKARKKANLSQKDLGILIGLDSSSASSRMNHYEKGRHTPDIKTLKRISLELGVPLNYFFCEDDITAELVIQIANLNNSEKEELLNQIKEKFKAK